MFLGLIAGLLVLGAVLLVPARPPRGKARSGGHAPAFRAAADLRRAALLTMLFSGGCGLLFLVNADGLLCDAGRRWPCWRAAAGRRPFRLVAGHAADNV